VSVATVKAQLATIQGAITGVKKAYPRRPNGLASANLPAFLNYVGPAQHDWESQGENNGLETRLYLMRLFIRPINSGAPGDPEADTEVWFARVRDTFSARPSLQGLIGVVEAVFVGDSGEIVLEYGGELYKGIEFKLQVTEQIGRTYASNE
jgi:hypothetical protein